MPETATVTPIADARKKMPFSVKYSQFGPPDTHWAQFQAEVPAGTKFKDVLRPEAWSAITRFFQSDAVTKDKEKKGSTILVATEDLEWRAELMVMKAMESGLIVKCIGPIIDKDGKGQPQYLQTVEAESNKYKSRWNPGAKGWDIMRVSDGAMVASARQLRTKEDVNGWLARAE